MRTPEKTCGKKIKYTSWGDALRAMEEIPRPKNDRPMTPYRCPFCGSYHLGHLRTRLVHRVGRRKGER
jgi:hypothetical protein